MDVSKVGGRHRLLVSRKCHHRARLVESCPTVCRPPTDSTDSTVNQSLTRLRAPAERTAAAEKSQTCFFKFPGCERLGRPCARAFLSRPGLRDTSHRCGHGGRFSVTVVGHLLGPSQKSAANGARVTSSALHLSWWNSSRLLCPARARSFKSNDNVQRLRQ